MALVEALAELPAIDIIALRSLEGGASLRLLLFTICFEDALLSPDYSSAVKLLSSLVLCIEWAALKGRLTFIELFKA